jgi:hypothetical protein
VSRAPSMRYLGVPEGSTPRRYLGLPDGALDVAAIDAALDRQRERIRRHPAAGERDAARLLRMLEQVAEELRAAALREEAQPTRSAPPAVRSAPGVALTEFDREVLATLVTMGGWNHRSRTRLLAIAARHGVGGKGLQKVLLGLAGALKSGAIRAQDRPQSAIASSGVWTRAQPSRLTVAFEQLDEVLSREVRGDTPGSLLRLLLVFVGVAVLAAYFLVVALSPSPPPPTPQPPPPSPEEIARTVEPPTAPVVPVERAGFVTPMRWPSPPFLKGAEPTDESRAAVRDVANAASELATLARKMQLEANRPSDQTFQRWDSIQESYAKCWPLLDPVTRVAGVEASVAVLRPIQSDDVAARFLAAWRVDAVMLDQPFGVWGGAWAAGMLAEVAARPSSPDSVAAQAIDRLESMVPRRALLKGRGTSVFEGAAGAWLDRAASFLAVPSTDATAFANRWERWFDAQAAVRKGPALEAAYIDAMGAVLGGSLAIAEAGSGSDLLGRLLGGVDWTERSADQRRARDAMTIWFTDRNLAASRLWVLTSMLDLSYEAAWFVPEFVSDPNADAETRSKQLERIMAAWPMPKGVSAVGGGVIVDRKSLERWRATLKRVDEAPGSAPVDRLRLALLYGRLNMAAQAFATGETDVADAELADIESELTTPRERRGVGSLTPGKTSGIDGEFAAEYEAAGRNETKRIEALRALRSRPTAGDLGPRDAQLFVEEALRSSSTDVRSLAQDILADRFASGPTVLLEVLDQLATGSLPDSVVTMIEEVTSEKFDDARGDERVRRVRLALIRRLLEFETSDARAIDSLSRDLAASFVERGRLFRIGFEEPPPELSAEAAASRLADQWRVKAGSIFLADPFPATLDELDRRRTVRRRLVEGAVQACAAELGSLIELVAAVAVADRPSMRAQAATVLQDCFDRRAKASSAIDQILELERGIARIYDLWFEPTEGGAGTPEQGNAI